VSRFSATLLLAALAMSGQELKVDHVTVAGRDLRSMMQALHSIGIPSEYGGPHANHATEMALTSFEDGSYLELIAIQRHADRAAVAAHYWRAYLEGNAGPCAWAVRPDDIAAEVERLRAASIPVSELRRDGRLRPDRVELEWETAGVGSNRGTFFPFLIHDFTPRDRRAFPSGKPTVLNWSGISKVVIGVRDLEGAIAQYERAYGLPAPEREQDLEFGAKLAWFRGTPVVLATPLLSDSWLDVRLRRFGDAPCAFVLARGKKSGITIKRGSNWFGKQVAWFDPSRLGWHLGVE
jgi:Glyoxalase-like domain